MNSEGRKSASGTTTLFVRHDPEVDAATLSFQENHRGGGRATTVEGPEGYLHGLVRVSQDGEFDHLEVLHASSAIPELLSELDPEQGTRGGFRRGTADVGAATAPDNSAITVTFTRTTEETVTVDVAPDGSGGVLARFRFLPDGRIVDVTLYAAGRFLDGVQSGP